MVWIHLAFKLSKFTFKESITTIYRQGVLLSVDTMEGKGENTLSKVGRQDKGLMVDTCHRKF